MEGAYFHGEHLRWNLGWENPNPAGAFVAMAIPWLWAVAAVTPIPAKRHWRWVVALAFLGEALLWFLLCKTYSRGALVAVLLAGAVFSGLTWYRIGGQRTMRRMVPRMLVIGGLLWGTGFFSRLDPGFVAGDASAVNRLTLWQGGLRMIAASPWRGWGTGNSGSGFMHWFQPLEADESYAGMVNSYLHVAVERGLPVLGGVLTLAFALLLLAAVLLRNDRRGSGGIPAGTAAAACSLVVFLVANVFSTLWIFANLWWLPALATAWILAAGIRCRTGVGWRVLGAGWLLACASTATLWWAGQTREAPTTIRLRKDGAVVCQAAGGSGVNVGILLPDPTVLGESWGKEVRRLALSDPELSIVVPVERDVPESDEFDGWLIACGARAGEGLAMQERVPDARVTLVHPLGQPDAEASVKATVNVFLPALDTGGAARRWRSVARRQGWGCRRSAGVGQDIRLRWPAVVAEAWARTP